MKQLLIKYYTEHDLPVQGFNLFGIRDESGLDKDVVNDQLGFFTSEEIFVCPGTTDPGVYWTLSKERNNGGTFHLLEGYHEKIWCIGKHKGYEALVNDWQKCKPTKGWRDSDYNFTRTAKDVVVCDYFGVNFHRMNQNIIVKLIGKYSAGCQVVQSPSDFDYILQKAKDSGQKTFNYMLFKQGEIS